MSKTRKVFFISVLTVLAVVFSYSMILEVSGYYQGFYPINPLRGWFIAILPESAILVLMAVKISGKGIAVPVINVTSKILVVLIFIITVTAAGLHVLKPSIKTLSELNRETTLMSILEQENQELQKDSESFQDTKQRTNLAITAKAKRENRGELKKLLREQRSPVLPVIEITLIFVLRIVIQIANLVFAYLIGHVYRLPSIREKSTAENKPKEQKEAKPDLKVFNNAVKGKAGRFTSKSS